MRYSYQSGYENFKQAQRTYIRSGPRPRVFFHLRMWGYAVVGVLLLTACAKSAFASGFHLLPFLGYMVGCGLLGGGIICPLLWPWQRRRSYRIWNGEDDILHLYIEVDGPFLITGRPGKAESRFERAAVCRVVEDDKLLLLFVTKKKFIYIPKSVGDSAMADINVWLASPGAPESC